MTSPRSEFLAGLKAQLPILIGVIPFGMIYGVVAVGAGLDGQSTQAMSAIVFAGSAQFVAAQLFGAGVPGLVIVLTGGVINLRHFLYSASLAPYLQHLSPKWKWLLAYLLTDEAYAVTITHFIKKVHPGGSTGVETPDNPKGFFASSMHWYFLGAGIALWVTWQASTAAGITLGAVIPQSWSIDFTVALTFIALLVPTLKERASVGAALTAGLMAVFMAGFPYRLGLLLAALMGILVGFWVEGRT